LNLLNEEKIQVIVTTLNSVYERLKDLNAPVYLMKHTKVTIRDTLTKAILKGKQQKKRKLKLLYYSFRLLVIFLDDIQINYLKSFSSKRKC
jgi:hypothetical protein